MKLLLGTIVLCIIFMLGGCAAKDTKSGRSTIEDRKFERSSIYKIKEGVTTKQEVIENLGSPDQMIEDGEGNITMQYKFGPPAIEPGSFKPVVGSFAGRENEHAHRVMVKVGADGIVTYVFSAYTGPRTGQVYGYSSSGGSDPLSDLEINKRLK